MKYILIFLSCLFFYHHSFSQTDTTEIPFVAYWAKGDSFEFKVTKVKNQWKEGQLTEADTATYYARFKVLDSTETSYRISWKYDFDMSRSLNIPAVLMDRILGYKSMDVLYTTTETGQFVGVENWEEIRDQTLGMFKDLLSVLEEESGKNVGEIQKAIAPLISVFESKEAIEQIILKELQYFHFPFGFALVVADTLEYEERLPNMFGGSPIPAQARVYVESVDFEEAHCELTYQLDIDPEASKNLLTSLFKRMGLNDDAFEEALEIAELNITDRNQFEYFYYPGIPVFIETRRETFAKLPQEEIKRVDMIQIEWVQ